MKYLLFILFFASLCFGRVERQYMTVYQHQCMNQRYCGIAANTNYWPIGTRMQIGRIISVVSEHRDYAYDEISLAVPRLTRWRAIRKIVLIYRN